ncbi:MAG: hypothetical protein ORN26_02095, partial [Candidatus Pacebacteria bacterium]|nr:hypothetical protein [Candidatus Paceibacterota bacterium]
MRKMSIDEKQINMSSFIHIDLQVKNKNLDQFYTKPDIAEMCIEYAFEKFPDIFHKKVNYLEPSAGTGSFIKGLEKNKIKNENIFGYD